jgi:hypothetical protein
MLPFCNGNAILTSLVGGENVRETLNEDYAHYLQTAPAAERDPWPMRLLPASIRNALKDRRAARDYENSLIAMWENSPHLLDDIGVVVSTGRDVIEGHVAAPSRVVEHVLGRKAEKAAPIPTWTQFEPASVDTAQAPKVWATVPRMAPQGGLPG